VRIARLAALAIAVPTAAAPASAQTVTLSVGPVVRTLDRGTDPMYKAGFVFAFDAAVGLRVTPALSLRLGGGIMMLHDQNVYNAPLPPGSTPCDCYATEELYQGRVGLSYERGRFLLGTGAVIADGGADEPRRLGGFGELRVRPFGGVLDVGVLAYQLSQSTGRHRAIVLPSIGLRF
jgi:hypothetical protein